MFDSSRIFKRHEFRNSVDIPDLRGDYRALTCFANESCGELRSVGGVEEQGSSSSTIAKLCANGFKSVDRFYLHKPRTVLIDTWN